MNTVEVWIDADIAPLTRVGTLEHDRGTVRFDHDPHWIDASFGFALAPGLPLQRGSFFPPKSMPLLGALLDAAPDRWGQALMDRREVLLARAESRRVRALHPWDYLLGVHDATRMGALRFLDPRTGAFIADGHPPAPPFARLREIEALAVALSRDAEAEGDDAAAWLTMLIAPGSSLGGARPKGCVTDTDGAQWLAKFPAADDRHDVGAWEWTSNRLAEACGITVPVSRLCRFSRHHTFCASRFDRTADRRRHVASAMTLLERSDGAGGSYPELAELVSNLGTTGTVGRDLEQLFRRALFNVMTGNRDDHLRNHAFIREVDGWRLAPAFDLTPAPDKPSHVLALDEADATPRVETVLETHDYYRLGAEQALGIARGIATVVATWPTVAKKAGISGTGQASMSPAFDAHTAWWSDGGGIWVPKSRRKSRLHRPG